jgi:hypothetical protein
VLLLNSSSRWGTAVIVLFFAAWTWTEVVEYLERTNFHTTVNEFMYAGDRFTSQDGNDLRDMISTNKTIISAMNRRMDADERRVERLQREIGELRGD